MARAAIILRACLHAIDDPARSPRSLTIHYASAPREGAVELATTVERRGRSLTTVSARLSQADKLIAIALTAAVPKISMPLIRHSPHFTQVYGFKCT